MKGPTPLKVMLQCVGSHPHPLDYIHHPTGKLDRRTGSDHFETHFHEQGSYLAVQDLQITNHHYLAHKGIDLEPMNAIPTTAGRVLDGPKAVQ